MMSPQQKAQIMLEVVERAFRAVRPDPSDDWFDDEDVERLVAELNSAANEKTVNGYPWVAYEFEVRICEGCGQPLVKFTAMFSGSEEPSKLIVHDGAPSTGGVVYAPYVPQGMPVSFGPKIKDALFGPPVVESELQQHYQKWAAKAGEN